MPEYVLSWTNVEDNRAPEYMPTIEISPSESLLRQERRQWARQCHGALARIARETRTSRSWVSQVLYGAPSADGEIERLLARAGAPGMAERVRERRKKSA
jgi:hypothetical protein